MYIFVMSVCGIFILFAMIKTHRFFRSLVISAIQGVTALFAVNLIGDFMGLHLSVNFFSLLVSCVSGLPGVIFLVVTDMVSLLS